MGEYNPISFKYLTGWGGEPDSIVTPGAIAGASLEEVCKLLRKYSRKDREFFRNKWRELYLFYINALLEEPTKELAVNDGYFRKIDKNLDLL
jgi:hypothetical protein